ncbi:peptide-methionine (S)-S-oxide reductase [Bacillus dakarensis]|uniref:peptide-methionine (S)-S-oxide reductase n=1 Tax=Robertmurraya dakarensis TaxID=1926278 RepID=UPI000982269F|nr:peptide-methionine (S)-S-oxide reductase [Bacillus dakarensis]
MERAVFGASEFFSEEAFVTGFRGIEYVKTGHLKGKNIDIVEIWFNPWKVSYDELLELFFDLHDPTSTGNYSMIFFSNKKQLNVAKNKKDEMKQIFKDKIITEITPASDVKNIFASLRH